MGMGLLLPAAQRVNTLEAERKALIRKAQRGDPEAVIEAYRRLGIHLPMVERRHDLPCVAGSCPAATGG